MSTTEQLREEVESLAHALSQSERQLAVVRADRKRERGVSAALQSTIERVRAIGPYSTPICGDRSRGYQMGWDAARTHILAILDGEDA
jgi:hypothetical protein